MICVLLTWLSSLCWSHGPHALHAIVYRGLSNWHSMTRVNNEHSMDGDYTREHLVNWLMSKNSVATCFIKDVFTMSELEGRGGFYFRLSTRISTHVRPDE